MVDALSKEAIATEVARVREAVRHPLDRYMGLYRLTEQRGEADPLVLAIRSAFVSDILDGKSNG